MAYYWLPPSGRTNYGTLITPQRDISQFAAQDLNNGPVTVSQLRGTWVMLHLAPASCDDACRKRLWIMRQVRATTGKDRDRVQRLWLVTDQGAPGAELMHVFEGTLAWRAREEDVRAMMLPADTGDVQAHIWLIDPLGHVMMRWPHDADPNRMKKDLARLLRASRVG